METGSPHSSFPADDEVGTGHLSPSYPYQGEVHGSPTPRHPPTGTQALPKT